MGGGAALAIWNQIKADVLGATYRPLAGVEAGTRGAALVAAAALGEPPAALPEDHYGPAAIPNTALSSTYSGRYGLYREWLEHLVASRGDNR
jgi:sugar (pentulose or hexulose) kinase